MKSGKNGKLLVAALCNGTVIDHIPSDQVFKVVSLLNLDRLDTPITIGNNLESKKMGTKGIIKIDNKYFEEDQINKIALVAPKVVLNIIKNYDVTEKKTVTLPQTIVGIVKCNNPKCITNNEPMSTHFELVDRENVVLSCRYCNLKIEKEDITLL
ncbi:aspartate carbamoyltransferase regulatory subunit [Dysgonomonas sp. 520]|uniref:aspartate carbamoyltransferase regulatory subunit n=1 Tax=Dysgonomonas sp. 520 TaxID=2302931 RepID=UPI0013D46E60|nr:aspartate carbamoyltransferase regulatory subunit [Dysgonomonas sp. 520]NDW09247.1 aspartate carbamoyltransferase regulatory subunit [Dysgonomonas sp. 520]